MLYCILDDDSADVYDAKIELDDTSILLHSRGGATGGRPPRNTDYEKALKIIIKRLRMDEAPNRPIIARILLDSQPARKKTAKERILAETNELTGLTDDQIVTLVRSRAKNWGRVPEASGGNSTKALRIETHDRSHASIYSLLQLTNWRIRSNINRLTVHQQAKVTTLHIDRAIKKLCSGTDAHNFRDSQDYDILLGDGTRLAPTKVFGLALEEALGIEAFPEHFTAGWSQPSFQAIKDAGYSIVPKNEPNLTPEEITQAETLLSSTGDLSGSREGTVKLVMHMRKERDPSLSYRKKTAFIAKHGFLFCERCSLNPTDCYGKEVASACIEVHHAKVQVKDMQEDHMTLLEDLQCLCANCHRVTHRELIVAPSEIKKGNRS
ncbi:hypothetical protein J2D73_04935 [Acetobacter sacchari]|uniref:HNH endonuclease n=1 Tax=Acetobacter sacchari TaxID=2661687 RepID=A0ABS3LTB2_9PROT|nr:hypothetical protein [Acetobacter sacchari]MBO1359142.1 hypothetical protein [Acetobacter sacchari]